MIGIELPGTPRRAPPPTRPDAVYSCYSLFMYICLNSYVPSLNVIAGKKLLGAGRNVSMRDRVIVCYVVHLDDEPGP